MRKYNEKHEATINYEFEILESNPKDGQMANYQAKVGKIEIYHQIKQNKYVKLNLSRDLIVDLFNQITEIELELDKKIYMDLPY